MYRLFDSDGDGHIDFKELWMTMYVMAQGSEEEKLKQVSYLSSLISKLHLFSFCFRFSNCMMLTMIKRCLRMNCKMLSKS